MKLHYSKQLDKEHKAGYCTLYSEIDFKRYLAGAMSLRERDLFEEHCVRGEDEIVCEECAVKLNHEGRNLSLEQDLLDEKRILDRTRELLKELIPQ